jgi:formylglycine-generating enzyme required for sulfatase activity
MINPINDIQINISPTRIEVKWNMQTNQRQFLWQPDNVEIRVTTHPASKLGKPSTSSSLDDVQVSTSVSQSGGISAGIPGVIDFGRDVGTETGTARPAIEWGTNVDTHWANIPTRLINIREPNKPFACSLVWPIETGVPQKATVEIGYIDKVGFHVEYAKTETAPTGITQPAVSIDTLPLLALSDNIKQLPIYQSQLMISYHRGTDGVETLVADLQKRHYSVWIDRRQIKLGDIDWQKAIQRGIYSSGGVILCLTNHAATRPVINWEMRTAIELEKPIFVIALENLDDISLCLKQLSLPTNLNIEPHLFTKRDTWEKGMDILVAGLEDANIRVTTQDRRKDRTSDEYSLHQHYLNSIVANPLISRLQLNAINPEPTNIQGTELERIYVPLPTRETLAVEVQDYRITDWWVGVAHTGNSRYSRQRVEISDYPLTHRTRPMDKGWSDEASLQQLVNAHQIELDDQFAEIERKIASGRSFSYTPTNDGVYPGRLSIFTEDIAAACDRLVILGGPGSGKSTFARHLVLCLAGEQLQNKVRNISLESVKNWPHGSLTPLYIELRAFISSKHFPENLNIMPTADHLWQYILDYVLGEDLVAYATQLKYDLTQGHALLVLDGLDEVPYPPGKNNLNKRQDQLKSFVRSLTDTYGKTRILVTSRPYAYEGWTLPGFTSVELAPFIDNERQDLMINLFRAGGDTDEIAQDKARRLNQSLRNVDPELKDRPLFVTLMSTIFATEEEGLPTHKGALYRKSVWLLLDRWTKSKPNARSLTELLGNTTPEELLNRLSELAYDVHEKAGDQQQVPEIPRQTLFMHLFQMQIDDPLVDATALLAYLSENAGVLVSPGDMSGQGEFYFAHRTFQEYLAAFHIASTCIENDSYRILYELITSNPQKWRVPCALVADVLSDKGRKSELWRLLADLLEAEPALQQGDPSWWAAWLASEITVEQRLHLQKKLNRRTERPIRDGLVSWLVAAIEVEALHPIERMACGRTLGLLEDPRSGVSLRPDGLPDIAWGNEVPSGTYIIGSNDQLSTTTIRLDYSLPEHEVTFDYNFRLSKYPVTMIQFDAFLQAEDGFGADEWWINSPVEETVLGHIYVLREPKEQYFGYQNHPRDSVSWYQAVAFCRWLTAKFKDLGLLDPMWEIRLPSEQEWEAAARYPDGRKYPYGNDFDKDKMNVADTGLGQSSPVGMFPSGRNELLDLYDLSGNVLEWCFTDYDSYAPRAWRGGSWHQGNVTRASIYYRRPIGVRGPSYHDNDYGFRLCVAPHGTLLGYK